ncbi:MAG: hypothetical protein Unbinned1643contig1000_16 [Prokaryotic dsDNA virus sp.]|nr:MAG: hypothetical protein Unbinned1643contig1000_16 [Prokaryotic dsDNA virus sp.]|tara:strand:- start:11092 stop:11394 length:303 start_codon:yes stop_codon:yes gene_type:complete
MVTETIYIQGVRIFAPHENAPDFVLGQGYITPKILVDFIKENPNVLSSEYDGNKQIPIQVTKKDDGGLALKFNDFTPKQKEVQTESIPVKSEQVDDDLPF